MKTKRSPLSSFPSPAFSPLKSPISILPPKQKSRISKKKPLPSGYEIDPSTGRKRKSCNNNQVRDPQTGRCKKIRSSKKKSLKTKSPLKIKRKKIKSFPKILSYSPVSSSNAFSPLKSPISILPPKQKSLISKKKPLPSGYEIDPSTGRKRKSCNNNQVRDPQTGRCKKIRSSKKKSLKRKSSPLRKTKSPVSTKTKSPLRKTKSLKRKSSPVSTKKKSPVRKIKSPVRKIKSSKKRSPIRYGNIFTNVRPQIDQQNLENFIIPYDESKCQDVCPICLIENDEEDSINLRDCRHCFHLECLRQWWSVSSKCPSCNRIYGFQIGNMPMGTMSARLERYTLPGSIYDTILITYNFPAGVTTANQPNPGTPYPQDIRNCYLEASPEGYEVLDLLRRSFERGLTFTIGDSLTTGRRNVVVWNGVHHKTSIHGGPAGFGFPDPGYYRRVKDELRAKGIF